MPFASESFSVVSPETHPNACSILFQRGFSNLSYGVLTVPTFSNPLFRSRILTLFCILNRLLHSLALGSSPRRFSGVV